MGRVYGNLLNQYPIMFEDMVEYDGFIWFVASNLNGLFKMERETGKITYLGKLPTAKERYLCSAIVYYNKKLYIISGSSREIFEYDVNLKKFTVYEVDHQYIDIGFYGAGHYEKYIYFWSYINYDIFQFDMEEKKVRIISAIDKKTEHRSTGKNHEYGVLWKGYCIVGNHLYIPSPENNVVLDIDMAIGSANMHTVAGIEGYLTICYDGEYFWLSGLDDCLVKCKFDTGETIVYEIDKEISVKKFRFCIYDQSQIVYSSSDCSTVFILNTQSMQFRLLHDCQGEKLNWKRVYPFKVIMLKKINNTIWLFNSQNDTLQMIEEGKRNTYEYQLSYGIEEFICERLRVDFVHKKCRGEDFDVQLNEFIDYVLESGVSEVKINYESIGERIKEEVEK